MEEQGEIQFFHGIWVIGKRDGTIEWLRRLSLNELERVLTRVLYRKTISACWIHWISFLAVPRRSLHFNDRNAISNCNNLLNNCFESSIGHHSLTHAVTIILGWRANCQLPTAKINFKSSRFSTAIEWHFLRWVREKSIKFMFWSGFVLSWAGQTSNWRYFSFPLVYRWMDKQ
jgi:hypothetical protein